MNSIGTLVGVRFIGAQKPLVQALGLNAAVFLNECLYWQSRAGEDQWFSRTIPQMTEETGLSKAEQVTVRAALLKLGLIEERKGVQYRTQTRIIVENFNTFLTEIQPTESDRLESSADGKPAASRRKVVGSYNNTNNNYSTEYEESALSPVVNEAPTTKPFDIWAAFCKGRGQDHRQLSGGALERQLFHAKTVIKDGISVQDVENMASWLQSIDWWRNKGFDLTAITNQYAKWVGLGKPKAEKVTGAKAIRGSTPSL